MLLPIGCERACHSIIEQVPGCCPSFVPRTAVVETTAMAVLAAALCRAGHVGGVISRALGLWNLGTPWGAPRPGLLQLQVYVREKVSGLAQRCAGCGCLGCHQGRRPGLPRPCPGPDLQPTALPQSLHFHHWT